MQKVATNLTEATDHFLLTNKMEVSMPPVQTEDVDLLVRKVEYRTLHTETTHSIA